MKYKLANARLRSSNEIMFLFQELGEPIIDILEQKRFLGIRYYAYKETILNIGQAEEVVYLMNNPDEMKRRLLNASECL